MRDKLHSLASPSMSEIISGIVTWGSYEFVPLSWSKKVYIEVEDLMKRHDERVHEEFEHWKKKNLY